MDKQVRNQRIYFRPCRHFHGGKTGVPYASDVASFFKSHFQCDTALFTEDGRTALSFILKHLKLSRKDEVHITTTFDFPNVSSCVTCTVFNYCKPSRVLTKNTRAALVIHEFGVPHPQMKQLQKICRQKNIPLIEDCAHTLNSAIDGKQVGTWGDWVVCSFQKIFPVRHGGILLSRNPVKGFPDKQYGLQREVSGLISPFINTLQDISKKRRDVYCHLTMEAEKYGLKLLFKARENVTPWFFPVHVPYVHVMMDAAHQAGVECALWHGTDMVVFPCHQYLAESHIKRIGEVMKKGLEFRQ